jgi:lysophospholipase L1-like esterase
MEDILMKKFISAVMAGAMAFSAMGAVSASAENYGEGDKIVIFGDSIAAGMGLADSEMCYGDIIADYLRGDVENYAVSGDTTADMINVMSNLNEEQKSAVADADTVIISIGGNDIIRFAVSDLLIYVSAIDCLADGVTLDKIDPNEVGLTEVLAMINKDKLKAFAADTNNKLALNKRLLELGKKIRFTDELDTRGQYKNYMLIQNQIVPNLKNAVSNIEVMNPDAKIIIQTIYNPLEFDKAYLAENYSETYQTIFTSVTPIVNDVLESYASQITAAFADNANVKIADVKKSFDSSDSIDTASSWYFTGIQNGGRSTDIHPNQIGHLQIAATILDAMGKKPAEDGSIFRSIYMANSNADKYPAAAKAGVEAYIGSYALGDVDDNNSIDSNDASSILKEYAAISTSGTGALNDAASKAADVDGIGGVSSTDASTVLKYYASISTGKNVTFHAFQAAQKNPTPVVEPVSLPDEGM